MKLQRLAIFERRKQRALARIKRGNRPRLSVYRSNRYSYAQIVSEAGAVLVSASEKELGKTKQTRVEVARKVGELLAEKAMKKGIREVAFNRGAYRYHGRVQALAEGARTKGLVF